MFYFKSDEEKKKEKKINPNHSSHLLIFLISMKSYYWSVILYLLTGQSAWSVKVLTGHINYAVVCRPAVHLACVIGMENQEEGSSDDN